MTLFSTTIQFYEFLLILYIGLSSGIIFQCLSCCLSYLDAKIKKKQTNIKTEGEKTRDSFKRKIKNLNIKFISFLSNSTLLLIFISVLFLSAFINYYYNMGNFSLFHIPLWVIAFFSGRRFVKTVAKFLICFYNVFKRRVFKNNEK